MIKHVICFKLKDNSEKEKIAAKEVLISMKGKVPTVIDIEVGTDFLLSARSYDVFLQVTLKDRASLDEYQADAYHCDVVKKYMHEHVSQSVAVDYEI